MSFKDSFLELLRTGRRRRTVDPGPVAECPALQDDDINFVLSEHVLRKYGSIEYVGEGAAEAEARRARRLGLTPKAEPQAAEPARKKRRRLSKKERLEKRLRQLQADVAKLEKAGK